MWKMIGFLIFFFFGFLDRQQLMRGLRVCSDRKKFPPKFDDRIVNYSHQTTIFHCNFKEKLRFVGFIT